MGNGSYSGVTGTLEGADDGDTYNCTASNGVSAATDSIMIRGDCAIVSLCIVCTIMYTVQLSVNQ